PARVEPDLESVDREKMNALPEHFPGPARSARKRSVTDDAAATVNLTAARHPPAEPRSARPTTAPERGCEAPHRRQEDGNAPCKLGRRSHPGIVRLHAHRDAFDALRGGSPTGLWRHRVGGRAIDEWTGRARARGHPVRHRR